MSRPRLKPYTTMGIRRVPCAHCGRPSTAQWMVRACAQGGPDRWRGLCDSCDTELNAVVLKFFRVPRAEELMTRYGQPA